MNSYNQDKSLNTAMARYKYEGNKDDPFKMIVKKYFSDVQDIMTNILQKTKKMSQEQAEKDVENMMTLGDKRQQDIAKEVEDCYVNGKTLKQCAEQLIEKYYKIAKVNKEQTKLSYQQNRELSGEGEITEVDESVRSLMKPKSEDELKISTKNFPPKKKMDYGVNHGVVHLVKLAIEEGVDVNTKDSYKKTPLIWVTSKSFTSADDIDIVKVLLEKGANVNHKDSFGMTALMFAAYKGDFEVVKLLLDNGADANIKDNNNKTAMDCAEIENHRTVMSLLRKSIMVDESAATEPFKYVSLSLFWNFINRISDLGLKFTFESAYVKNLANSLNTKGYVLYMETPKINNREVEYEFKHSKMLSNILTYIMGKETSNETSFYVGFDGKKQLHFGFIVNNKKYKIGYTDYNSYNFQQLTPHIRANKEIDLIKLSKKFVSNIEALDSIKTILSLYLDKYDDDIVIYKTILNSNFGIVVESLDDEVVSQQYIEDIIKKYVKISHYSNWYVQKMKSQDKTFYYFILK